MITINLDKARLIAHEKRRAARAEEFKPYDDIIMKQISDIDAKASEAARQLIRDKYAELQIAMDAATTVEGLKELLP